MFESLAKAVVGSGKRDCSGKHGLRPYKTPNDSMVCKGCSTKMAKGVDFRLLIIIVFAAFFFGVANISFFD